MVVLDTNVVSELMKATPDGQVHKWLLSLGEMPLTTTAVTAAEIEYGLQRLPAGKRRTDLRDRFAALLEALTVLPLDEIAARRAGQLRAERDAKGMPSTVSDMLIAGIAAAANAQLATRNARDFEGLHLPVIDPWRAN